MTPAEATLWLAHVLAATWGSFSEAERKAEHERTNRCAARIMDHHRRRVNHAAE